MKKISLIICFCLICLFLSAQNLFAENAKPGDENFSLLREVEKSYQAMKNFKADFNQELLHRESNTTEKRTGSLKFLQPQFIFWETNAPEQEIIVANDKEVWNYLPAEELAYHYSLKVLDTSHAILSVITGQANLEDNFEVEFLADDPQNHTKSFTLYPLEANAQMVELTLTVDTESKHIRKLLVLDFFGNLNTIEFTRFAENISLAEKDFNLTLPKDTEIEDHFED